MKTLIRNLPYLVWGTVIGSMLMLILVIGTAPKSSAAQPYGGCDEAGRYPHSMGAEDCREMGWIIRPGLSISPRHVLRYYDLPSCRYEDGSGQRRACGWNVTAGNGNGRGLVYIALSVKGWDDDGYIYLNRCRDGVCKAWRR